MFGSLRLLSPELLRGCSSSSPAGREELRVRCVCTECGRVVTPAWSNVKLGKTTRCVHCAQKSAAKHRQLNIWGRTPDETDQWIRLKWFAIRGRCDEPTNKSYNDYGGRGIRLSQEFHNPIAFIDYMRSLPLADVAMERGLEVDRTDNDRGYERGNLRWATRKQQENNKRTSLHVTYDGKRLLFDDFVGQYCSVGRSEAYKMYHAGEPLGAIVAKKGRGPRGPYRTGLRHRERRAAAPLPDERSHSV